MDAIYVPLSNANPNKLQALGIRFMIGSKEDFQSLDLNPFNLMDDIYCIKMFDTFKISAQKNISYIMHTSGTTRNGLGGLRVSVPTDSFVYNLHSIMDRLCKASQISRICCPLVSETTFDPSLVEICLPLLYSYENNPGSLVILERDTPRMPQKLFDCINAAPINLLMMTPSLFMSLSYIHRKSICQGETRIKDLVLGGEDFPESLLSINPKSIRFWNIYGTTECSVWAFMGLVESSPVTLGVPLGSTEWKIENGRMYLGGEKRICYLGDEVEPLLLRDTGDLVKKDADSFYYLGRSDSMIKRHGYRIHLLQIAQEIQALDIFQHYKVVYIDQGYINAIICFYVGQAVSDEYVRGKIKENLPWYSIPSFFWLESFPLSAHGKVDVAALKEIYAASLHSDESVSLRHIIAVGLNLKSEDIDINRHFLAIGGSSFMGALIIHKISDHLRINQLPQSERIKSNLLNSLFNDTIAIFIDFAERCTPKVVDCNKENQFIATDLPHSKEICRNICPPFKLKWKMDLEKCVDASPIIHDNILFVGSHSGLFVAIECSLGSLKWSRQFAERIEGSSAVSPDGTIVVFGCYDHCIYALCTKTGDVMSKFATNGIVKACPIFDLDQQSIWVGSYDHFLYCIAPITNELVYSINLGSSIRSKCSINPKTKCIIASTLKGSIFSLHAEGTELKIHWKRTFGPVFSDPLLDESSGDVFIGCTDNSLYRLCGNTGSILWKKSTHGPIFSSPKFWSDENIAIGSHSKMLFCISKYDGKIVKTFKSDSPIFGSPLTFLDKCCFVSIDGIMYIISKTGTVDSFQLNNKVFSSPIYLDSTVYVGCRDNHIYAILLKECH